MSDNKDKILFYGYLLLLIYIPLPLASNRPWAWAVMEIWIFCLCITWLVLFLRSDVRPSNSLLKARIPIYLLCWVILWIGIQTLPLQTLPLKTITAETNHQASTELLTSIINPGAYISLNPAAGKTALLKSTAYLLLFMLTLQLVRSHHRLRTTMLLLIAAGSCQAIFASLMLSTNFGSATQAHGTFVNSNHLGAYLEMSAALVVGLLLANRIHPKPLPQTLPASGLLGYLELNTPLLICLLLMSITIALTGSRMAILALLASFFLTFLVAILNARTVKLLPAPTFARLIYHKIKNFRKLLKVGILVSTLCCAMIFLAGLFITTVNNGSRSVLNKIASGLAHENRFDYYLYSLNMLSDYWLTGIGAGAFYGVFPHYRTQKIQEFIHHAHNDYLEFLVELGLIGFLPLSLFVISCFTAAIKAQHIRSSPLMRGVAYACIMAITAMLIHSAVDFNLQIPANASLFIIVCALPWICLHTERAKKRN
ncbi:MAG: O-antigen ligase family protein [Pseudomonadales bacterium]|nr:O-antigen ligase family protein [Pseudomonadales bacterium]